MTRTSRHLRHDAQVYENSGAIATKVDDDLTRAGGSTAYSRPPR
jgi:hypothetical protein